MLTVDVPLNTMLADLDETLRTLLRTELERHGFEGVDIAFDAPAREWSGQLSKPTVNIFLYDLREAETLRTSEWSRIQRDGRTFEGRPPMVMECSYAVTAWTQAVEDEHRLLSQVLAIFYAYPEIPQSALNGRLANGSQQWPIKARIGQGKGEKSDFWSAIGGQYKVSLDYVVRLSVDSGAKLERGPKSALRPCARGSRTARHGRSSRCTAPSARSATRRANRWPTCGSRFRMSERGPRAPPTAAFASTACRPAVTGCWRARRTAWRPSRSLKCPVPGSTW